MNEPNWLAGGAACLDDWDTFAPAEGIASHGDAKRERVARALSICNACPMLNACRVWALKSRPYGTVVAGMDLTSEQSPDEEGDLARLSVALARLPTSAVDCTTRLCTCYSIMGDRYRGGQYKP